MSRTAQTSVPISPVLAERWSPRAFDSSRAVDEALITAALESARWAPSASNSQPARFILGVRGTETFQLILDALVEFNQAWASGAPVLVANLVDSTVPDGQQATWQEYDLGQAVALFVAQAHRDGLHAHQMGGFDPAKLAAHFALGPQYRPLSVTALGYIGDPSVLPERLRDRELDPRTRKGLDEIVLVRS